MEKKQINTFLKIFPLVFILVGVLIGTVHYGISIEFLLILDTVICCIIAFAAGYKLGRIRIIIYPLLIF